MRLTNPDWTQHLTQLCVKRKRKAEPTKQTDPRRGAGEESLPLSHSFNRNEAEELPRGSGEWMDLK